MFVNLAVSTQVVELKNGEQYRNLQGTIVHNSVILEPFQGIILLDEGFNSAYYITTTGSTSSTDSVTTTEATSSETTDATSNSVFLSCYLFNFLFLFLLFIN